MSLRHEQYYRVTPARVVPRTAILKGFMINGVTGVTGVTYFKNMGALAWKSSTRAKEKKRILRAIADVIADIVADIVADGGKYSYRPNKRIDFVITM